MTRAGVLVLLTVVYTLWLGSEVSARRLRELGDRARCSGTMRQLALCAIQYADDRRSFPHARGLAELDGGVATSDGARAFASLVRTGWAEGDFTTCAATPDESPAGVRDRDSGPDRPAPSWTWSGRPFDPSKSDPDPVLATTRQLSYGWTRRALPVTAPSNRLLFGDRALLEPGGVREAGDDPLQGNHPGGVQVAAADGTVVWVPLARAGDRYAARDNAVERLVATQAPGDGYLGILDPTRPRPGRRALSALALAPLGLLGLLAALSLQRGRDRVDPGKGAS